MRDAQRPATLTLCRTYWNSERQRFCLAVVADGNTEVFDFPNREKVYVLASQAMAGLGNQELGPE